MFFIYFALLLIGPNSSQAIKYTLTTSTNEVIHRDEDTIRSENGAKKLIIQDEFHVFSDDILDITERTSIFIMDKNYQLQKLEKGAFVDQEITETIVISNTQVAVIKKGTFKSLRIFELILKDNEIERIEEEAISDLPNLEIVNLSRNKIVKIRDDSFVDAPARFIDLAFNQIKEVGENWFSFMSTGDLCTVLLDNNDIENVDFAAFEGIELETLNLRSNRIEELPEEIFEGDFLKRVYLQDNSLEGLPHSFFKLTKLRFANLGGNNFECETRRKLGQLAQEIKAVILYEKSC